MSQLLEEGENIGGFILDKNLGRGTFTETWRAHHAKTNELATLKVFQDWIFHVELLSTKLSDEAETLKNVSHPSLVPLLDYHFASRMGERSFLVMPFIEGEPLHRWLYEKKPTPKEIVTLFLPVLEGLDQMNKAGVLHLNVRPSNILVDRNGRALLTDSDLSGAFKLPRAVAPDVLEYSSPERLAGKAPSSASDVYSIACVLLKSLGGEPPTWVTDNHATAKCRIEMPEHTAALSGGLGAILEKSLSQDAAMRFQTCGELATALKKWIEGRSSDVMQLSGRPSRNRVPMLIGVSAVLALAIGSYFMIGQSSANVDSRRGGSGTQSFSGSSTAHGTESGFGAGSVEPLTGVASGSAAPKQGGSSRPVNARTHLPSAAGAAGIGTTAGVGTAAAIKGAAGKGLTGKSTGQTGAGVTASAGNCDQLELELPAVCRDADCRRKKEACKIPEI